MFEFREQEKQLIKSLVHYFNIASEKLKFKNKILVMSDKNLKAPFITNDTSIEIKDDFGQLIHLYGTYAGSVVIINRIMNALYAFLLENYDEVMLNEQFYKVKEEIVSRFISNQDITNQLEYCLLQDNLINRSEKEEKNIEIALAFGSAIKPLHNHFYLNPVDNKMKPLEGRLKQLQRSRKKSARNHLLYETVNLSELTKYLSDSNEFNLKKKSFNDIQFKPKDIKKSFYATMKSYAKATDQFKIHPKEEELNKYVENLLKNVAKEEDHNFNKSYYTFNDTLLIIAHCILKRLLPGPNKYWQLLNHDKKVLSRYQMPKNMTNDIPSDEIIKKLFTHNKDKKILNEDFAKLVEVISNVIPKHLVILKNDPINDLDNYSPEDYKDDNDLVFHFENTPSYYPLHQVFKDFYIYYFKGFSDLRVLMKYTRKLIKENMYNSYTNNEHFDIFAFNNSLKNTINIFKFKDIEYSNNNNNSSKSLSLSNENLSKSLNSIRYIHSKSSFSLFDDIDFLGEYQTKIISNRKNK